DGTIAGWSQNVNGGTKAVIAVKPSAQNAAVYKGLALATYHGNIDLLYATDFHNGTVDVFNSNFKKVTLPGHFEDPFLPPDTGYAPFNIQKVGNDLYVTYAKQDADAHDDAPGAGHGFIDVYDTGGRFERRFATGGVLDSPWGMAVAPKSFGKFGG